MLRRGGPAAMRVAPSFWRARGLPAGFRWASCRESVASPGDAAAPPQRSRRSGAGGSSRCLAGVKAIVAVASAKGGVGKSSVCVNLAYAMQKQLGARVGILDADVYGPSLPAFVPDSVAAKHGPVRQSPNGGMEPLMFEGVPLMSMGFLRPGEFSAIRGPMVSGIVQQMLTNTEWGELDYLLVDMPPGTGDIHLTVAQVAEIDAAIMVTTPQQLSLIDVEKGIRMFDKVGIPTAAILENMSFFLCSCGKRHEVFRRGAGEQMANRFGIERYFRLAVEPLVSEPGLPFVLADAAQGTAALAEFQRLAEEASQAVTELRGNLFRTSIRREVGGSLLIIEPDKGQEYAVPARNVLLECRSARMRDEFTGQKLFKDEDIPQSVLATTVSTAGRYAANIEWSNGHSSLFSLAFLGEIAKKQGQRWHAAKEDA